MAKRARKKVRKLGLGVPREVPADEAPAPSITVFDFVDNRVEEQEISDVEELVHYQDRPTPTWIDVSGDHALPTLQRVAEIFNLHFLTLEDILSRDQRPKVEEFEDHMLIVLQQPSFQKHIQVEQVSLILTPTIVVSFHERAPGRFSPIHSRMHRERQRIVRLGTDYLAYVIVDTIVDGYFSTLERVEDKLQELDREILQARPTDNPMEPIHEMRQELIVLRRSCWPLREVISSLRYTSSPLFDQKIKVYLKDLQDHIFQIIEVIEVYRDMVRGMLDMYLSTMSHHMNQIMKTLTMIASIFIPLTLITGIYGMNFVDMPELHWALGYPMVIGAMILVAGGMLFWFKRKGWF